jgi:FixJ family two-component response regulator
MFRLTTTTSKNVRTPGIGLLPRPDVYLLVRDPSERAKLEVALAESGFQVEALQDEGLLSSSPARVEPHCLVVDCSILEVLDVKELGMPMVCLTLPGDVVSTVRAMKAGAVDVFTKPTQADLLIDAIRRGLDLSAVLLKQRSEQRQLEDLYADLSQREREVMAHVVTGLMNKHVAFELGISEITVKAHRGRVMRKMNARSLAGLVQMANRLGLTTAHGIKGGS